MCPGLAFNIGNGGSVSNAESLNLRSKYCFKAGMYFSVAGYGILAGRAGGDRRSPSFGVRSEM